MKKLVTISSPILTSELIDVLVNYSAEYDRIGDQASNEYFYSVDSFEIVNEYQCPHCGYFMPEDEAEGCCDCGCPSCRKYIDWSDHQDLIDFLPDEMKEITEYLNSNLELISDQL